MQFKVGDQVVHTRHGSGQIVAIEEKQLAGSASRLFYVVVTTASKSTVWVGVDSGADASLRPQASKDDLIQCRTLLKSRPASLNADRRQRYLELANRLRQSSFAGACEVVRDLAAHGWPKSLSESDASALRKVQETVSLEWAAAADVPLLEARREIMSLLQEGRRTYST